MFFQRGSTAVHFCTKSADLMSLAVLLENGAQTDVYDNVSITYLPIFVPQNVGLFVLLAQSISKGSKFALCHTFIFIEFQMHLNGCPPMS